MITSLGTLIGTDELAQIRTDLAASYTDTCDILRPLPLDQRRGRSGGLSAGAALRAQPQPVTSVLCRTAPDFQPPAERTTGGALATQRFWVVYLPPVLPNEEHVLSGDLLRITNPETQAEYLLEVIGVNPRRSLDLEQTVRCQEIGTPALPLPAVPLST